ncbi:MAG: hypothetical protein M1536_03285, partial [Firmicutes bacterium]|nr:hypothetical protein [Bacillota bacterium]
MQIKETVTESECSMPSCINCGKEYQAGDNYCAGCGDILSKENEVQSKKIKLEEQIPYYKSSNRNFLWYFFILFIAGLIIFYYSWRPSPAHKGSRTFKNPITSFFKEMNTKAKMKKKGGCHIIIQLSP